MGKSIRSMLALLLLTAACSSTRQIREEVRPTQSGGRTTASYALPAGAEASVWSEGIYRKDAATVIHVGIAVDNDGDEPIVVDALAARLEKVDVGDDELTYLPATKLDGDVIVQPGEEREVELTFALPAGVDPQDVDGFEVRWVARAGGDTVTNVTGFHETSRLRYDPMAHHGSGVVRTAGAPAESVVY